MRDRLMLGEQTMVELSVNGPEPQGFELSYMVESESELRELIEGWGGAGVFWRLFDVSSSGGLLSATPITEDGRRMRVWVHLSGEDFAPPSPAPLPLVERLRQEGLQAIDTAIEAADLDLAGRDRPADAGSAESVALVELDRLEAADAS